MQSAPKHRLFTLTVLLTLPLLGGCSFGDLLELHPRGPVAQSEWDLMLIAIGLMLIVLIPVFLMTFWFPWRYRASNQKASYRPDWSKSFKLDAIVWLVPALIVLTLASLTWIYTHRLQPSVPLESEEPPLEIQVIALDWKWLFIYPQQRIAVVNHLVIPTHRPIQFDITSDTVMNAFFIPQLGSQIYAMAGMRTRLNLLADKPGSYFGENTQYSGRGFPYQHFEAVATSQQEFERWVAKTKGSPERLTNTEFRTLEKPSIDDPVHHYGGVEPGLFEHVLKKYAPNATPANP
jgi:cytochrome o ubiquinol oxidase subunit II